MKGENGTPITPDWAPEAREAPDFTRSLVNPTATGLTVPLCKQHVDGRGDQ